MNPVTTTPIIPMAPITRALAVAMLLSGVSASAMAQQVHKWVDAQGRTHYSEKKPDNAAQRSDEVRLAPLPTPAPMVQQPQAAPRPAPVASAPGPAGVSRERSAALRSQDPATRECALARGILDGSMVHRNGKPTDAYDREVAANDVKRACR